MLQRPAYPRPIRLPPLRSPLILLLLLAILAALLPPPAALPTLPDSKPVVVGAEPLALDVKSGDRISELGDQEAAVSSGSLAANAESAAAAPAPDTPLAGGEARPLRSSSRSSQDLRRLPASVASLPELIEQRTANTATFQHPDGSFTSIVSASDLHYRDQLGRWLPIDPAFRRTERGFIVQANSIRSRAGSRRAAFSAAAGEVSFSWQATALGVAAAGRLSTLAEPLEQMSESANQRMAHGQVRDRNLPVAERSADSRTLTYRRHWSDPGLVEKLVSAPATLEHLLVLTRPPRTPADSPTRPPASLELQARLKLLPGTRLWADGQAQSVAFRTAGALEIHDESGRPTVAFEPVWAYEQDDPAVAVRGEYVVRPAGEPDTWIVGLRTPWQWWHDPGRRYPAVIDPVMRVLRPNGSGTTGLAWVTKGGCTTDSPTPGFFQGNRIVIGSVFCSGQYWGYMQFNAMPAQLTNNAPLFITQAKLTLIPQYWFRPGYKHDSDYPDWKNEDISRPVQLYDVTTCADPTTTPGCFSLKDNRVINDTVLFNWSTKPGGSFAYPPTTLTVGPTSGGGQGKPTEIDVTDAVRTWYQQVPQPKHGPVFAIRRTDSECDYSKAFMDNNLIEDDPYEVRRCTRFKLTPENTQLEITYQAISLSAAGNQNLLNDPGVPSYVKDVLADTNHQYDVQTASGRWQGIAVRGNHKLYDPSPTPANTGLKLLDQQDTILADGDVGSDVTSYVLIDTHNASAQNTTLKAHVVRSEQNDYAGDQERNYRIHYERSWQWSPSNPPPQPGIPDGTWRTETHFFPTDDLISLREFGLGAKFSGGIIVTTTVKGTAALDLALVEPTSGGLGSALRTPNGQGGDGVQTEFIATGAGARVLEFGGQNTSGWYALTLTNDDQPGFGDGDNGYQVQISILACPDGTIPTRKYDCQPIIMPHDSSILGYATATTQALGLDIYSEGGFIAPGPGGETWCTANEQLGTPLIGPFTTPAGTESWVYVAQGSICYDGDTQTLFTTEESGVGLVYPQSYTQPDGTTRGQRAPAVTIYGSPLIYPANPAATGRLSCTGTCTALAPTPTTLHRITPFQDWGASFTINSEGINLTAAPRGTHVADGTLDLSVIVDANDPAYDRTWQVDWELYPTPNASYPNPASPNDFLRYNFNVNLNQTQAFPQPLDLASLELRLLDGDDGNATGLVLTADNVIKTTGPKTRQIRAPFAKITLPPELGGGQPGATKKGQAVILPPGRARTTPADDHDDPTITYCGSASQSCLELRRPEYQFDNGNGVVKLVDLPDVFITDQIGTIMFSRPGQLLIFSNDHPDAGRLVAAQAGLRPSLTPNFEQSFAFESWGATVKVTEETCDTSEVVTVIRGSAAIALPMLGDDGSSGVSPPQSPAVLMDFKLCETALKYVKLILSIKPAYIPVGATGVGVDMLGGEVTIAPDHTEITLKVGFRSVPSDAVLSNGIGQVTIDTRGMFAVQASATIVGVLDADLQLQVAWNPLDILFKAQVGAFGGLITGQLKMHAWVGQGWQNKYSWLPANNDFHFTGSIQATLFIEEDYVIEWVPPFDISLGVRIAFGEFCKNESCTQYAWGMSGTMTISGFTVGLYVDDDGPEFILGTDDHVLIDEFGSKAKEAGGEWRVASGEIQTRRPASSQTTLGPQAPPPPDITLIEPPGYYQPYLKVAPKSPVAHWPKVGPASYGCDTVSLPHTITCPFTINAGAAGRAVFSVGWQNGELAVSLIKPDNTVVTQTMPGVVVTQTLALGKRVTFSATPTGGAALEAGQWKLRISGDYLPNGGPNSEHHNYTMLFASDPPPPTLNWITPAGQVDGTNQINLQWTAIRGSQAVTEPLELFYTPLAAKPVTETELISATMIANGISAGDGSYLWDTSGLASGEYAVVARIDDHKRGNGHPVFWAPGSVVISDTTPPPVPVIWGTKSITDALVVAWGHVSAQDLAGYLVEYTYPAWDNQDLQRVKRVLPRARFNNWWNMILPERTRLGGLLEGYQTTLCVRSYDASGNVSDCTETIVDVHSRPSSRMGAPIRLEAGTVRNPFGGTAALRAVWDAPLTGVPAGYVLAYEPTGCQILGANQPADQGISPLDVGNVGQFDLTGLTQGQRYRIIVAAYDDIHLTGPAASTIAMFASVADGNGDGLPDAWASVFGVTGNTADAEGDGLTNIEEFNLGTYPTKADSDYDGYGDGEEVDAGTDPCDGADYPSQPPAPKLVLSGSNVVQVATPANLNAIPPQIIEFFDFGNGELFWMASASDPWIVLRALDGKEKGSGSITAEGFEETPLEISIDTARLPRPGTYRGTVDIISENFLGQKSGKAALAAPEMVTIDVTVEIQPERFFNLFDLQRIAGVWNTASRQWDVTGDGWISIQDVQIAAGLWRP